MENNLIEAPVVTLSNDKESLTLHNYISLKGKMVVNKSEAALLLIELMNFIKFDEDE